MSDSAADDIAISAGKGAASRPGRVLADARVAKGMTLAEVAAQLKLSPSQVTALEADDYASLPGPVFVRGFIRNYARLLEQDAEQLSGSVDLPPVSASAATAIPLSRNIPFPVQKSGSWIPYALVLLAVIGLAAAYEFFYAAPPEVVVSAPQLPAPSTPIIAEVVNGIIPVQAPSETAEIAETAVLAAPPETTVVESAIAEKPSATPAPAPAGMAEVHIVFSATSWVEVRDRSERILLSQLNAAGTEQRLVGRPPLSVVVGNARDVRLTFKGKPFDLVPHTRVEVARFILE